MQTFKLGLILGLLWTFEISINNFLHPPLPQRDIIDDLFWVTIAVVIFLLSAYHSYEKKKISVGIKAGFWLGFGSGLVACVTALLLIIFGMKYILSDPLSIAEWANQTPSIQIPDMPTYFIYQTLAGAILHLVVLGIGMGILLGIVGGVVGRVIDIEAKKVGKYLR